MASADQSLDVYWGGLLNNGCAPLEITLNWCDVGCRYCFANLNDPNRTAQVKQLYRMLSSYQDRDTLAAQLLRDRYPIVISNKVDPLSKSNIDITMPLLPTLQELGLPYTLQTKGGIGFYKVLPILDRPIVWYWSLMTLSDEVIRKIEPGAPKPRERLEMMRRCVERGDRVVAGINPTIEEWTGDPVPLVAALKDAGASGIWVQRLHLSDKQTANMPAPSKRAIGEDILKRARRPRQDAAFNDHFRRVRDAVLDAGLEVYTGQQPNKSNFFQPYKDVYGDRRYPLNQDFVNWCHEHKQDGDPVYFDEWIRCLNESGRLPEGVWRTREHLGAIAGRSQLNGLFIPQRGTYADLLRHIWKWAETVLSPINIECFAIAETDDGLYEKRDRNGLHILVFKPNGTPNVYEKLGRGKLGK